MKLFNLNVGIKLDNNKEVVDLILKDNYDIVTLQESMRKLDEGVFSQYDSCDFIRKHTSFKNNFFGAVWVARVHKKNNKIHRDFGGYVEQGNQLLSNYPIIKSSNVFYYKEYSNYEDSTNFRKEDHPRAFIECVLDINGKELQVINVHGLWTSDKMGNDRTQSQIDAILNRARKDIPCIIVGDFNLLPTSKYIKILSDNSVEVSDNGRGVPTGMHKSGKPTAELVYTKLHAGGKFSSQGGYKTSSGLHGVGASVVNALSEFMDVTINRDYTVYNISFEKGGKLKKPLKIIGKSNNKKFTE